MFTTLGRGLSRQNRPASPTVTSLKNTLPSCVFDLDATQIASYGGSGQSWQNLVTAPADGSTRGTYDFYVGTNGSSATNDPVFTGQPERHRRIGRAMAGTGSMRIIIPAGYYPTCTARMPAAPAPSALRFAHPALSWNPPFWQRKTGRHNMGSAFARSAPMAALAGCRRMDPARSKPATFWLAAAWL